MLQTHVQKILIIKLGALGDFIQAFSFIAAIRKAHPKAHITLLTTKPFEKFAQDSKYCDDIWIDEKPKFFNFVKCRAFQKKLNAAGFDRVYDLQNNTTLSELTKQALFTDILQSVDISIGEVNHKSDHLDLGIFNWFFITPSENEQVIHCKNSNLYSPSLKVISQSPLLKKQLWQVINQNLL